MIHNVTSLPGSPRRRFTASSKSMLMVEAPPNITMRYVRLNARVGCRRVAHDLLDDEEAVDLADRDAEPAEAPLLRELQLAIRCAASADRVRVEHLPTGR